MDSERSTEKDNREGLPVDAEARILAAVANVERKVDRLVESTGVFEKDTIKALAKIEQLELDCPINSVQAAAYQARDLAREAKHIAEASKAENKRLSALISTVITTIGGGIMAMLGLGRH